MRLRRLSGGSHGEPSNHAGRLPLLEV
jgi:hypothetical protein